MKFWGPKRWNYFLPVFKAPQKCSGKNSVFLALTSLFFDPFFKSSSNIHQQPPEQKHWKRGWLPSPFWKACFWVKTPESDEKSAPPLKTWFTQILWNHYFYRLKMMWPSYWPNGGPVIDSKNPQMWPSYWPYNIYIYHNALKLKSGPIFALFKVKKWSNFLYIFWFLFFNNLVPPAQRRGFLKNKPKNNKKNTIVKVNKWSNYVAQHNWTTF